MSLIDSPLRNSLSEQSNTIRAILKDYEREFFARHSRKPGKDDIKQNADIAAQYKQYNKVRDVLSGRLSHAALHEDIPQSKKRKRRTEASVAEADTVPVSRSSRHEQTPRKAAKLLRPDQLDPYDAPSSVSPRPPILALGPTPQRDGMVMGIFDLMSRSGSSSKRQRMINLFDEDPAPQTTAQASPKTSQSPTKQQIVDDTPARTRSADLLQYLSATPATNRVNKHSRTPASSAKKFRLSQFFATPSTIRYASLLGDHDADEAANPTSTAPKTPLLDRVLGHTPSKPADDTAQAQPTTPAYLKRNYSFKQRLLSASTGSAPSSRPHSRSNSFTSTHPQLQPPQPFGPRSHLQNAKFNPRPLSQIAREMQERESQRKEDERLRREAATGDDDELDALREVEVNDPDGRTIVRDSQADAEPDSAELAWEEVDGDGDTANQDAAESETDKKPKQKPPRVWKKKGQKRTTRRVIMRPSKVKVSDPRYRNTSPGREQSSDESDAEPDGHDRVGETQLQPLPALRGEIDADANGLEAIFASGSDFDDELLKPVVVPAKKTARKPKKKTPIQAATADETDEEEYVTRKINPNAQSHMNFRSLKIRNRNSRANRGRGRGRGRR
jgi:DNA replication regulator SLD2